MECSKLIAVYTEIQNVRTKHYQTKMEAILYSLKNQNLFFKVTVIKTVEACAEDKQADRLEENV